MYLSQYDILQVIKMKQDFPSVKFVVLGGGEASLVSFCSSIGRNERTRQRPDNYAQLSGGQGTGSG